MNDINSNARQLTENQVLIKRLIHSARISCCDFSPNGKLLAAASEDGTVRLWEIESGKELIIFEGHNEKANFCTFNPSGYSLASAGGDKTVRLWDANSGKEKAVFRGHTDIVLFCSFSVDGKLIVSSGKDGTIRLWDMQTAEQISVFKANSAGINFCTYDAGGEIIVSVGDDQLVRLWDVNTGEEKAVLRGHTDRVLSCALSVDGKLLVSSGEDGTIRLWDMQTGKQISVLKAHTAGVVSCTLSPDGQSIASAGRDNSVRLWDVKSGKEVAILKGHTDSILFCTFSPNGLSLASTGADMSVRLWDMDKALSPPYLDENVQFTVYRPKAVKPEKDYDLLFYAHLSELLPDTSPGVPDPVEEVKRQANVILGEQRSDYQDLTQDSGQPVPRQGELLVIPEVHGIEFIPPSRKFSWVGNVHQERFLLRASSDVDVKTKYGKVSVFLGRIILAEISISIKVDGKLVDTGSKPLQNEKSSAKKYRKIFASYSHRDSKVVEEFEHYAYAVGDEYLRDVVHLRTGEVWSKRLEQMISDADIFQLFWSNNSMHSTYVEQEWRHALSLQRPSFIRPIYWEEPFPEKKDSNLPPEELRQLHFQRVSPVGQKTEEFESEQNRESKQVADKPKYQKEQVDQTHLPINWDNGDHCYGEKKQVSCPFCGVQSHGEVEYMFCPHCGMRSSDTGMKEPNRDEVFVKQDLPPQAFGPAKAESKLDRRPCLSKITLFLLLAFGSYFLTFLSPWFWLLSGPLMLYALLNLLSVFKTK